MYNNRIDNPQMLCDEKTVKKKIIHKRGWLRGGNISLTLRKRISLNMYIGLLQFTWNIFKGVLTYLFLGRVCSYQQPCWAV